VIESQLQSELLLLAPARIPDLRLWRRNIAVVRIEGRVMRSGIAGQADLYGYWRGGKPIEIELKALHGRVSKEQLRWEAFCKQWWISYLRLRPLKGETTAQTVERWISEIVAVRPSSVS
jgi:hypothetical protein